MSSSGAVQAAVVLALERKPTRYPYHKAHPAFSINILRTPGMVSIDGLLTAVDGFCYRPANPAYRVDIGMIRSQCLLRHVFLPTYIHDDFCN